MGRGAISQNHFINHIAALNTPKDPYGTIAAIVEVHTGVMIQISAAPFTALPGRLFDDPVYVYSWGKPHNLFSSSLYPNHLYPLY